MYGVNTWEQVRGLQFYFNKVVDAPDIEIERVHPLQQRYAKKIHDVLVNDCRVKRVILFGSSTNMRCTIHSDLDLLVVMHDVSNQAKLSVSEMIQEACDWKADIVWYDRLCANERIVEEARMGVIIK